MLPEHYIAKQIADASTLSVNGALDNAQAGYNEEPLTKLDEDVQGWNPTDASIEQGRTAIVANVKRQDEEKAKEQEVARFARAVAAAMAPSVQVGKAESVGRVVGVKMEPTTLPESKETIQAGIKAVGTGGRKGVFSELPFDAEDVPEGWDVMQTEDGGWLANPKENTSEIVQNEKAGERHKTLGYAQEKPEDADRVVQVKKADGTVVQDVATNFIGQRGAIEQALDVAGNIKDATVGVIAPQQALDERVQGLQKETTKAVVASRDINSDLRKVMQFENNKDYKPGGYNHKLGTWIPHKSIEGGTDTVAYGHKLTQAEVKSGSIVIDGEVVPYAKGLTDEQADKLFLQDWDKHWRLAERTYPGVKDEQLQSLTEMLYQGINIKNWKAGESLRIAQRTDNPSDWFTVQRRVLNSKWATLQTPERALDVIHRIYPATNIDVLKKLQSRFTKEREARGQVAYGK